MEGERFVVELDHRGGFAFGVDFGPGFPELIVDEPPPLGSGRGPNAARLLAAAIGNCLSASLLLCLSKARVEVVELRTTVEGGFVRNEEGRLRMDAVEVRLEPVVSGGDQARIDRCLTLFEDYCTVTASVRQGVAVAVGVDIVDSATVETGGGP